MSTPFLDPKYFAIINPNTDMVFYQCDDLFHSLAKLNNEFKRLGDFLNFIHTYTLRSPQTKSHKNLQAENIRWHTPMNLIDRQRLYDIFFRMAMKNPGKLEKIRPIERMSYSILDILKTSIFVDSWDYFNHFQEQKKKKIKDLEDKKSELIKGNQTLTNKVSSLEKAKQELEEENRSLKEENKIQKEENARYEAIKAQRDNLPPEEVTELMKPLAEENNQLRGEIKHLEAQCKEKDETIKELKAKLNSNIPPSPPQKRPSQKPKKPQRKSYVRLTYW